MSIRSLVKRRSWPFATPLLPALMASCSLEVAGIQEGSSVSSGEGQTSPAADTGQGAGGATNTTVSGGTTPPVTHCGVGTIDEIYDSFDDDVTNMMFWSAFSDGKKGETSISEGGGFVTAVSSSTKAFKVGYYQTGHTRKLNDCRAFIEVREVGTPSQPISTFFELLDDSQDDSKKSFYNITQLQGHLDFNVTIDGETMPGISKEITYDATEHRWWRFRESQGTSYMETSPDGKTWTTQVNFKTPMFASNVRIKFGMSATGDVKTGSTSIFDNLNVPPPP